MSRIMALVVESRFSGRGVMPPVKEDALGFRAWEGRDRSAVCCAMIGLVFDRKGICR
jgi:hypothetical protein